MPVSNTSTLVLLAKIDCLETFIGLSKTIEIPIQVNQEALFYEESYYARLIEKLIKEEKIKVISVNENEVDKVMKQFRLDKGEAAAYVMFNKEKHDAILTDDGELIKLCKLREIPFICSMAIVIRLYERKRLTKENTIYRLKQLNEIGRYSKEIYEYFKNKVE